jgi:imidazolonepropionase-like amidohydrolase
MRAAPFVLLFALGARTGAQTIALRGATVHTGTGSVIAGATILVENGKIAAVGRDVPVPAGVRVLDVRGKHVVPGFIDNHSHIGRAANAPPPSLTFRMAEVIDEHDPGWHSALSGGVTTIVTGPGGGGGLGGEAVVIKTFGASVKERILLENGGFKIAVGRREPKSGMAVLAMLRTTFAKGREYAESWRQWDAGGRRGPAPARDAGMEAIARVLRHEDYIRVHVNAATDIMAVLELKDEFGFDLSLHHAVEAYKVLGEIAKRNVSVVGLPLFMRIPMTEAAMQSPAAVRRAGIPFAFHADDPVSNTKWLRLSAGLAMRYGMSEEDALKGLTITAAQIARVSKRVGSIEPGKDADLVVLDGPWFEFMTHVDMVLVDGTVAFDRMRDEKP